MNNVIDVDARNTLEPNVGEYCFLHPRFIYDPETGKGKLFENPSLAVRFLKKDEDPSYAWVQDNPGSEAERVRSIQLLPFPDNNRVA